MKAFSWSWAPIWAIGCAAIANAVMISVSLSARPEVVPIAPSPSGGADASVAARRRFERSGARLAVDRREGGVRLTLLGGSLRDVAIACERPSDARLDQRADWRDPALPLNLSLPAAGRWSVRLKALDSGGQAVEQVAEIMLPH
jgi:hypothetical protein